MCKQVRKSVLRRARQSARCLCQEWSHRRAACKSLPQATLWLSKTDLTRGSAFLKGSLLDDGDQGQALGLFLAHRLLSFRTMKSNSSNFEKLNKVFKFIIFENYGWLVQSQMQFFTGLANHRCLETAPETV